jgi:hypothetical protein
MRSFMFFGTNHVWLKLTRSLCSFITKPSVHTVASPKSKRSPPTLTRVCRLHRRSCSFTQPPSPHKEKHLAVGIGLLRWCSRKGEQHGNIDISACPLSATVLLGMVCSHRELHASSILLIVFVST